MTKTHTVGAKLTEKEVDEILASEASFAQYMATLTVAQIDDLLAAASQNDAMTRLLKSVRAERSHAEQQIGWKLGPVVTGLAVVTTLNEQIAMLEKIQSDVA